MDLKQWLKESFPEKCLAIYNILIDFLSDETIVMDKKIVECVSSRLKQSSLGW